MKRWPGRLVFVACALLGLGPAFGCARASDPDQTEVDAPPMPTSSEQVLPTTLEEARAQIDSAIGGAEASALSECALAALGVRPCGGPRTYLAYSLAQTDSAALAALIEVYDRLDRERNEREGLVSTCELMVPPDLAIENGRCVTR
jgi:hypothetical protein